MTAVPSPVTGSRSELALPLIPKLLGTSPFPAALPAELEPPPLLLLRDLPFPNGFRDAIIFDKLFSPPPPPPLLTVAAVVEDIPAPAPKTAGARRESSSLCRHTITIPGVRPTAADQEPRRTF